MLLDQAAAADVVLTLDYPGFQQRGRVADIVEPRLDVRPLMTAPLPCGLSSMAYAEALVDAVAVDRPVSAVVAYCSTGPIAHEVARLATGPGAPAPLLVLLDGAPCPATMVANEFTLLVTRFGGDGPPRVSPTQDMLLGSPTGLLAAMAAELTEHATRDLARSGLEVDDVAAHLVRELVGKAVDWLTQLVAAHNAPLVPWPGEVVLVCSRDQDFAGPWPHVSASSVRRVDCAHDDLLRHPDTRRVVMEALDARSSA